MNAEAGCGENGATKENDPGCHPAGVLMEWDDSLLTGEAEIDRQHMEIFRIANEMHLSILEGKGRERRGMALETLSSYVRDHCALEERWMAEAGYPALATHRAVHSRITAAVAVMVQDPDNVTPLQYVQFLNALIHRHIHEMDAPMMRWIRASGASGGDVPRALNVKD